MLREKDLQYKKVWQFCYRNCSSQQRWQIRCLMESGIPAVLCIPSCCVVSPPSLCLQTSGDLPCSSVSCLSSGKKKKKKNVPVLCVNMSPQCAWAHARTYMGKVDKGYNLKQITVSRWSRSTRQVCSCTAPSLKDGGKKQAFEMSPLLRIFLKSHQVTA